MQRLRGAGHRALLPDGAQDAGDHLVRVAQHWAHQPAAAA
jgi:hypothetical protein